MTDFFNSVGMEYVVIGLAAALLLALILVIVALVKVGKLKKRYEKFLSGKDGKSLEESIVKRFDKLKTLVESQIAENNKEYVNTIQKVLVEGKSKNNDKMLTGRTETNKVVVFEGSDNLINNIIDVKLIEDHMWYFKGETINECR